MPEDEQIVEDQHFVPRFYLRRFTNNAGLLSRLDLENVVMLDPGTPKAECHDSFFYGIETGKKDVVSQEVEEFLGRIENYVAPKIQAIEEKIMGSKQLNDEDLDVLAALGALLWVRTPLVREIINQSTSKFIKDMVQMRAESSHYVEDMMRLAKDKKSGIPSTLTIEQAEDVRQFALSGEFDVSVDNKPHLQLVVSRFQDFYSMFRAAKWRFYIAGGGRVFVTSTAPCIEVFPENPGFYGNHFYARKKLFPLSLRIMTSIEAPWEPGKTVKRKTVNDHQVLKLNVQQARWSSFPGESIYSRCYGPRNKELEELIEARIKYGPEGVIKRAVRHHLSAIHDFS